MSSLSGKERDEILRWLEEWRRLEGQDSQFFMKMVSRAESEFLKTLYRRLSYDSLRHSSILSSIRNILTGNERSSVKVQGQDLRRIRHHLTAETEAIIYAGMLVKKIPDKNIKFLLNQIVADENQHHKILSHIIKESESKPAKR